MSDNKPVSKTVIFDDPKVPGNDKAVAVVTVSAAKIGRGSNYFELRDGEGKTLVHITWPDKLKPREV